MESRATLAQILGVNDEKHCVFNDSGLGCATLTTIMNGIQPQSGGPPEWPRTKRRGASRITSGQRARCFQNGLGLKGGGLHNCLGPKGGASIMASDQKGGPPEWLPAERAGALKTNARARPQCMTRTCGADPGFPRNHYFPQHASPAGGPPQ